MIKLLTFKNSNITFTSWKFLISEKLNNSLIFTPQESSLKLTPDFTPCNWLLNSSSDRRIKLQELLFQKVVKLYNIKVFRLSFTKKTLA